MIRPDLKKKCAIVTGGAGGIGSTMARALSHCGAHVVLVDLDPVRLAAAHERLKASGSRNIDIRVADVSDPAQALDAVTFAGQIGGGVDILVNNAAIGPTTLENAPGTKSLKFWESDESLWRRCVDVNVNGTFLMARAAVQEMLKNGWGRIINISTSILTMQRAGTSPYGVTKAAIEAETQIWAKDLMSTGVTVNTLAPGGAVDTEFVSSATRTAAREGRVLLLSPNVMEAPLLYIASPAADRITGQRYVGCKWEVDADPLIAEAAAREPAFSGADMGGQP